MQINYNETTLVGVCLNPKNNTHRFLFKSGLPSPDDVFRVISTPAPACHSPEPRAQMRIYISIFPAHYSAGLPVFLCSFQVLRRPPSPVLITLGRRAMPSDISARSKHRRSLVLTMIASKMSPLNPRGRRDCAAFLSAG